MQKNGNSQICLKVTSIPSQLRTHTTRRIHLINEQIFR